MIRSTSLEANSATDAPKGDGTTGSIKTDSLASTGQDGASDPLTPSLTSTDSPNNLTGSTDLGSGQNNQFAAAEPIGGGGLAAGGDVGGGAVGGDSGAVSAAPAV